MAKTTPRRDPVREQLHELAALRDLPPLAKDHPRHDERHKLLRSGLTARSCFVVAAAVELVRESDRELLALFDEVYARFLVDPVRDDKGCTAKTAIVRALKRIDSQDDTLFRRGLLYVQREPVFGGSQDTAVELRGICALGLARLSPPDVLDLLAELLADREQGARAAAARALGCTGRDGASPLLRYKALCGDAQSEILTECLTSLLQLEGKAALSFVLRFLGSADPSISDAAALSLGQSRLPAAIPLLKDYAGRLLPSECKPALIALAMLRLPEATDHLLALVQEGERVVAAQAVEALGMHRYDRALMDRLATILAVRKDSALSQAAARLVSGR